MNWYYYDGVQQVGPVSESELLQARQSGLINDASLVWREGMANWVSYREAFPQPAAPVVPPQISPLTGQAQCCECRGFFPPDDMIRHGSLFVCANCKPIFLQRLREGTVGGASARLAGGVPEAQIRERDYQHDIGDYFSQSWALFKKDPGLMMGACVLIGLCWAVANFMPYLGSITGLIFSGPLLGGLFSFILRKERGQTATVGDAFSGFGPRFGQLLLGHFIPSLLASLAFIPGAIVMIIGIFVMAASGRTSGGPPAAFIATMATGAVLLLIGACVMIYFTYCWFFTLWLVADKNMTFWPAMALSRAVVCKHWWMTLLLGIVIGLIGGAGLLLCGIGLLVAAPVGLGMMALAYEKLFGDMQPA